MQRARMCFWLGLFVQQTTGIPSIPLCKHFHSFLLLRWCLSHPLYLSKENRQFGSKMTDSKYFTTTKKGMIHHNSIFSFLEKSIDKQKMHQFKNELYIFCHTGTSTLFEWIVSGNFNNVYKNITCSVHVRMQHDHHICLSEFLVFQTNQYCFNLRHFTVSKLNYWLTFTWQSMNINQNILNYTSQVTWYINFPRSA